MRVLIAFILTLIFLPLAYAQERPLPLPPVVVIGVPLTPSATPDRLRSEEDTRRELERGSGLRNNFHLRGVNVLLDGFPYGNADGFSDFESLELFATKYVEVYKGANALRFGANSLGGAINLVTKTGYDAGLLELRSEAGSFGFLKNYLATGQVYGPFDLYLGFTDTELDGYRGHSEQTRRRLYSTYGYRLAGGTTLRLDVSYVRNEENLPGSLTREEFERNPRQRNPAAVFAAEARNYDYTRVAFTVRTPLTTTQALESGTQFNYQNLDHPLSFAIINDVTYNWGTELRYLLTAPLLGHANRFTLGLQYAGTNQGGHIMQQNSVSISHFLLVGLLGCIAVALAGRPHAGEAQEGQRQADAVCRGFVVLPNGFAVLSGLHVHPEPGSAGAQHGATHAGATVAAKGHTASAPQHLMGYTHGQEIVPQAGMLCVPVGSTSTLTWTAVSHAPTLTVIAESLKGALTHGSRAHAAFTLTVRRDGAPIDAAHVRLLARMPSHDRRMPGGHGPANDPDVQGLAAQPAGQGRYSIPTVDFSMGGPWLLEVQVQEGAETRKAYFAASIGEE